MSKYFNLKSVVLQNNSAGFKGWANPPAKILKKYYFFDVQNPDQVKAGKQKPILKEKGPYTYRQVNKN